MSLLTGKIRTNGKGDFVDDSGRTIQLKGINLDGGAKFPKIPYLPSHKPISGDDGVFFDGDNVSFVGRPFPLDEALDHLKRIKGLGYNTIRYIITWEAIEHKGPKQYDEDFIEYTAKILRIIHDLGGLYVYIDPHQDVWSRFSGGDGAPMWTLYAAGFDPKGFNKTEAAILQNYFPQDPDSYPKMLWTTNYKRLVSGTIFVLFFAGRTFAPNAIINGVNIQDYLQTHFIDAFTYLVERLVELEPGIINTSLIGIETMNEPNSGYIGTPDITQLPKEQNLRLGTCPTVFQSLKLGVGIPTEVDEYKISVTGPKKIGTKFVDPAEASAWLKTDHYDKFYGFERAESWKLGTCLWEQNGVWNSSTETPLVLDYFNTHPETGDKIDEEYFINYFFVDFYSSFRKSIRKLIPDFFIFIQPPPLQIPPKLRDTDLIDDNTIFCPHYYDGMSLMFKTWNRKYNVDTLGIMRGRYSNPIFGIVIGEGAIRRSFKKQFLEMKGEAIENLGENIPLIFSEIGMPFDMDNKRAYEDDDFDSQTSALDAFGFALEGSNLSHTWWCYTSDNCHKWGDRFNCEDFSFWSKDDDDGNSFSSSVNSLPRSIPKSKGITSSNDTWNNTTDNESSNNESSGSLRSTKVKYNDKIVSTYQKPSHEGLRAIDSTIRPYALAISGSFLDAEFDLAKTTYTLKIKGSRKTKEPTLIYLPKWHFDFDDISVDITSGYFQIKDGTETLEWFHESGEQTIVIKSLSSDAADESWSSYLLGCLSCLE